MGEPTIKAARPPALASSVQLGTSGSQPLWKGRKRQARGTLAALGNLADVMQFIAEQKAKRPDADKELVQAEFVRRFAPEQRRSLFLGPDYALRFSEIHGSSFSNTVLSLSALRPVDVVPVVVCVVSPSAVRFLLANSTFLRKISHSSHELRADNLRGSFNGSDIMSEYEGIANAPEHFDQLFAIHSAFAWAENLERLVEATNAIVGRDLRFRPTAAQRAIILEAPARAEAAIASGRLAELEEELRGTVRGRHVEILQAAAAENVNLRGNRIEQLVTGGGNVHDLGDLRRDLGPGDLVIDVKTKLAGRASAPKAYNIDKMLAFHATTDSVFAFLMLGVDVPARTVIVRLVPVFDEALLEATVVQHHWAGRTSRGVTQLAGRFERVLAQGYQPRVNLARAKAFLEELLED